MAILDMLWRISGQSIGHLLGEVRRKEIAVYVASGRSDTTPPQEIEYLQLLVEKSRLALASKTQVSFERRQARLG